MDSLPLDLEEMETQRGRDWVRRRRREAGVFPDEPSTWFAWLETDHPDDPDRALVTLGRSPADVLMGAWLYAVARSGTRRGTGRWLLENRAGERADGVGSLYLIVRAEHDPDAPKYAEFAEESPRARS